MYQQNKTKDYGDYPPVLKTVKHRGEFLRPCIFNNLPNTRNQ